MAAPHLTYDDILDARARLIAIFAQRAHRPIVVSGVPFDREFDYARLDDLTARIRGMKYKGPMKKTEMFTVPADNASP